MKKTTKKTKTTTRAKSAKALPPAPNGLSVLLSLIDDYPQSDSIYARARQIVADRERFAAGYNNAILGRESMEAVFPGLQDEKGSGKADNTSIKAGVILGAAVAWLLLTDLAGGAR